MSVLKNLILTGIILVYSHAHGGDFSRPYSLHGSHADGDWIEHMQLRGSLKLAAHKVNDLRAVELSALAWDEDEQLLYALSDDGHLLHLGVQFENGMLVSASMLNAHSLTDADGKVLPKDDRDSEGLEILNANNGLKGDSELLVSFEIRPRIIRYSPAGEWIDAVVLGEELSDISNYYGRNSALESVILHPQLGILTLPQHALNSTPADNFAIHSLDGKSWLYPPVDEDSAAVGMAMAHDQSVILLERIFKSIFQPVRFALRRAQLEPGQTRARISELFHFNSTQNWSIDNFEGITHHRDGRYFIISDDNNSAIQKTLLIYVALDPDRETAAETTAD